MPLPIPGLARPASALAPPPGAVLDRGHPLAQGLALYLAFGEGGGGGVAEAAHPDPLTLVAGSAWAASLGGIGLDCTANAQGTSDPLADYLKLQPPLTLVVRAYQVAAPTANAAYFGVAYTNADTAPFKGYAIGCDSSGGVQAQINDGTALKSTPAWGATPTAGAIHTLVATFPTAAGSGGGNFDSGFINVYDNGTKNPQGGTAYTANGVVGYTANSTFGVGYYPPVTGRNCGATILMAAIYTRGLSTGEMRQIQADPYGMLVAPRRRLWVAVPAAFTWQQLVDPMAGMPAEFAYRPEVIGY